MLGIREERLSLLFYFFPLMFSDFSYHALTKLSCPEYANTLWWTIVKCWGL